MLEKVPGSLRSDGLTLVAVSKVTRSGLHAQASKYRMPLSDYLKLIASGDVIPTKVAKDMEAAAYRKVAEAERARGELMGFMALVATKGDVPLATEFVKFMSEKAVKEKATRAILQPTLGLETA